MKNQFKYTLDNKRYHTWNYFLKNKFGSKVYKVPLSLGKTCPNRDGTKGVGGCSFCLEGGGGTDYISGSLLEQYNMAVKPLEAKWPDSLSMPYFQSYSNTYVQADLLKSALEEALTLPKTVGICIATRPDCLEDEIVGVLKAISQKIFLIVELGLQSVHEETAKLINRGHSWDEFVAGYNRLAEVGIPVCVHLINGLPHEDKAMMLTTAKKVAQLEPHSMKFHALHILEGTKLSEDYKTVPFPIITREEYVDIVCDQLEIMPPVTVVQRVTGDPSQEALVEPKWTLDKLWVRNSIDKELARRNSFQGIKYTKKQL